MENKRYYAHIKNIDIWVPINGDDFCSFIIHFGKYSDLEIYDVEDKMIAISTKGTAILNYYPDLKDRQFALLKAKINLFKYLDNREFKKQKKRVYPKKEYRKLYIFLKNYDRGGV